MIAVFYGEDEFSAGEALDALRAQLDTDGQLAATTERVEGADAQPDQLLALCRTMPFLSAHRLIVVRGLLGRFESTGGRRGRRTDTGLGPWEPFVEGLRDLPETTTLVFLDGKLGANNPFLSALKPLAELREFSSLKQNDVASWINRRAARYGLSLEARATATLAGLVGADLRTLDGELQKLATYAAGRLVSAEDVRALVSLAREPNLFAWCDAVAEGRAKDAAELLQRLLAEGEPPPRLLVMLARQYRLLLLTKELQAKRLRPPEIASRLGVRPFVAQRLLQQAPRHSIEGLRAAYRRLLEADLSIKRGVYDAETALYLLTVELANAAGSPPSRRTAGVG